MSPTIQMASAATYAPISDAVDRHEYGISKNRRPASTGGGRAWSDDEEVYLLQTRLQKMPYKHIAAHLKKTELACRLHYHQLSHGSNRRKRTTSVSSGSSVGGHSPILPASVPSPIHELSPTPSPPDSSDSYGLVTDSLQLPSIMPSGGSSINHVAPVSRVSSPRLPTILPKPLSPMPLTLSAGPLAALRGNCSSSLMPEAPVGAASMLPHSAPLLPSATFTTTPTGIRAPSSATTASSCPSASVPVSSGMPALRLDCSLLPPPPPMSGAASVVPHHPVDMGRLQAVYFAHRVAFWELIASEYGHGSSPTVLEQAWRSSSLVPSNSASYQHAPHHQTATPLTPGTSLDDREAFYSVKGSQGGLQDRTRISAILGIDANPRSPKEREIVRRLEEERVVPVSVAA